MNRRIFSSLAAAMVGAALLAPAAAQAGNVSWGVSIGVPGFAAYAGQPVFGWGPPLAIAPAPVIVSRPVVVPRRVIVAPPPVFVPAPVYVRPIRWHRHRPVIVYRGW